MQSEDTSAHKCGWVVLMGPPNAGKSTFLNSVLGQKVTIVTPRPQTTRNQIVGILTEKNYQVNFMDTPGLTKMRGHLSKSMLQAVWQSMASADAILLFLDSHLYIRKPEFLKNDLGFLIEALAEEKRPVIVVVNKIDLFSDKSKMLPLLAELSEMWPAAEIVPVSALKRNGLENIVQLLVKSLPVAPPLFPADQITNVPVKFMTAEIIREKLFIQLRQEIPYSVAVDIESWEDGLKKEQTIIHATIYVSRATHKAMVIGKGGSSIKIIGTEARKEIQELIGARVHLELWVKVRERWTEDIEFIRNLGLGLT